MGELIHVAKVKIYMDKRPNRRAYIEDFPEPLRFGTHGAIAKALYRTEPEEPLPTTLEHIIAAVGG